MREFVRSASRYLDDHWILKWFVVPVRFMASRVVVLGRLPTSRAGETGQLAGLFIGFSLAVVAVGLALDWGLRRIAGWDLLASSRERGE
jgi:hypothetical protein